MGDEHEKLTPDEAPHRIRDGIKELSQVLAEERIEHPYACAASAS
jgi:hypothetical protein